MSSDHHDEEALGRAYDSRLMRRLLGYLRPYKLTVGVAIVLLLAGTALQLYQTILIQQAIDRFIVPKDLEGLGGITLLFFGVMLMTFIASYSETLLTMWLGQKVQHDIRRQVFSHLQKLHLGYYDKNPVGRLLTRVTNDVNVLNEMFSSGVVTIIGDIFMLVLIIGALLYYDWKLALWTFLALPLLLIATTIFRKKVRETYRQVRLKLARLNSFTQEHITGIKIVQLFTREKRTFEKFDSINRDLQTQHFRSVTYYAIFYPTVGFIGTLSVVLLLYKGGMNINQGLLTWGELAAFIRLVEMFYRPIQDLSDKYNILQSSMASSERIFQLLDTAPAIAEPSTTTTESHADKKLQGKLEVKNLWFAYNDTDWVLRDVSFTVEPGEKVAIVGATGAGKSSLISLLYRFYDYQKGSISLDGIEINKLPVDKLRSRLGLVLQDVFLFSRDYAGNVRLRNEEITDEQIQTALERVGYGRFMDELPDGLATKIKERGATLSTGQKQLLSFARALAFDPPILILDEATSSVDTETEQLIQRALEELLKGRTSIIIAHRLSTIEKADKIIVLHHGQLREMGRHDELLAQRGLYYKLYQMQYKKNAIAARGVPSTPLDEVRG
ncbi:MAG: ABC transporter ATP-binding protein [candidate division Zixibacteria bacterium]|nr:ABC transporter ATP-binding protein [candidate division Zixibacteria bacterium]